MNAIWFYSLASVLVVSIVSFVGVFSLNVRVERLKKILIFLVSFSAGALLGDVFIHLLPDRVEKAGFSLSLSVCILLGILIFFVLEKIIQWRHCHIPISKGHIHSYAYMNLIGDGLHNFIDGMIIAASYIAGFEVGIATTIAVVLHEIPQEIGDFGVLLHGGFSRWKALWVNFLSGLLAVFGAIVALWLSSFVGSIENILIGIAAGGFIYIAGSDLIPELHKEFNIKRSAGEIVMIILGILVMVWVA